MLFDIERVKENVREATTEDLLDRATVYRAGMEPEALAIIETELARRGVQPAEIDAHEAQRRPETIPRPDGTVVPCSFCDRPAIEQHWGLYKKWGVVPLFPWFFSYCKEHLPPETSIEDPEVKFENRE